MDKFVYELTSSDTNGGESVLFCVDYGEIGIPCQEIVVNSYCNSVTVNLSIEDLNSAKFFDLAKKLLEYEIKNGIVKKN